MQPNDSRQALVTIDNLYFSYRCASRNSPPLFEGLSLSIPGSSHFGIMGASGSGKSSLARLIAGIEQPDSGEVRFADSLSSRKDVVYVDQDSWNSVFPWQPVRKNLTFPLRKLGWGTAEVKERVAELVCAFELEDVLDALPRELSGGELQRVALARCLSWRPKLTILDEAFNALNSSMRSKVHAALIDQVSSEGLTMVIISHSVNDILTMCSECILLGGSPSKIQSTIAIGSTFPRTGDDKSYTLAEQQLLDHVREGVI